LLNTYSAEERIGRNEDATRNKSWHQKNLQKNTSTKDSAASTASHSQNPNHFLLSWDQYQDSMLK